MREVLVARTRWHPRDRHHQAAPATTVLSGDVVLRDEHGSTVAVQLVCPEAQWFDGLAYALRGLTWDDGTTGKRSSQARLSGMRYMSRVFGFTEPKPLRKRYGCAAAALTNDTPYVATALSTFTAAAWDALRANAPTDAAVHDELVTSRIHKDWLIGGLPFTSGIINNNAALPYHRDSGNIRGTWSAMLVLRRHVEGGALHLPEYDVTFAAEDRSLILFDGQAAYHGVTPLRKMRRDGYRFSMVYYAKSAMRQCGCASDEARRAAVKATERVERAYR